jgi:hypothetical protein
MAEWGHRSRQAAALVVVALTLAAAGNAGAATRYAAPDGDGPFATCPKSDPCDLETAVEAAVVQDGDEVVVSSGAYSLGAEQLNVEKGIVVRGEDGGTMPELRFEDASPAGHLRVASANAVVRRFEVVYRGTGSALSLGAGTAKRLLVDSEGSTACDVLGGILRDSVCWSHGTGVKDAVVAGASGGGPFTVRLRNVTAVASGSDGFGVEAGAGPSTVVTIDAVGVIASGATADAAALANSGGTATVTLDHSNYATECEATGAVACGGAAGATVTDPGSGDNQTGEPLFVDAAAGDFRQYLGSTTINAGALDGFSGGHDLEGEPRTMGLAADIGADEFDPAPPNTRIKSHPRRETTKRRAKFRFVSSHPGSTFECRLDYAAYAACESPQLFTGLPRGRHRFRARATDELGKVESEPARVAWKIVRD